MATKDKPNNKNLRALFSVICLCIVALGLIVYFSTQSSHTTDVNEATTVVEKAKEKKVTTTKAVQLTTASQTEKQTTKKQNSKKPTTVTSTEVSTMSSSDTNIPYKSFYKYPCDEAVLSGYSEELVENKTMKDYRAHTAVDFKANKGSKVRSINDGLVLSVSKDAMLGTVIEIDHGGKLVARYCGMDTVNVSEGDYVTIGETLGTLGTIPFEEKSEAHLHFETLLDNKYVNPLDVMGKTEQFLRK